MKSFGMTDVGKKRAINQDYLFYSDEPVGCFSNLYIVADGMGGHKAGDKASSYVVNRFVDLAGETVSDDPISAMTDILTIVNKEVFELSNEEEAYHGMGTTFVAVSIDEDTAYIINVGDSRLYRYSDELKQITLDHSLVEELVRAGELSPEQSRNHPQKNIITRAVGVAPDVEPDSFVIDLKTDDRILLCSDGLTNMVDDDRLAEIIGETGTLEDTVKTCISEALYYGGNDNIAVVIAQYDNGGKEPC